MRKILMILSMLLAFSPLTMKRLFLISLALAVISAAACGKNDDPFLSGQPGQPGQTTEGEDDNNENQENDMGNDTIRLTVNGRSFTATLIKNSSTEALKQRLAQGDIRIRMNDYGNMEKVGSLGFSLPRNDRQTTTGPGDLILYQGNSLVIYYDTNSWNFTRLGHVDGVSTREEMLKLLGGTGEITLTISLNRTKDEK